MHRLALEQRHQHLRIRDFRGLNGKSFDGNGNFTFGLKEQMVFQEIGYENVEKVTGMNVTLTTTADTDDEGRALLKHLGLPLKN